MGLRTHMRALGNLAQRLQAHSQRKSQKRTHMTLLSAGMTRDEAFALLGEHNKDPFHIEHGETVEQTMRYSAREYDPENEEFCGIVGLLHDLDWE